MKTLIMLGTLAGLFSILPAQEAGAVLLNYEFRGGASFASYLDLGGGQIDIGGAAFIATGHTNNDIDLYGGGAVGDGIGQFAATSTYSFGALGAFTTDAADDYYYQDYGTSASVGGSGLIDTSSPGGGFAGVFLFPQVDGDPDFGVATGFHDNLFAAGGNRTLTNSLGHILHLEVTSALTSMDITERDVPEVPEPSSIAVLALLLGGVGLAGKRRVRRSH